MTKVNDQDRTRAELSYGWRLNSKKTLKKYKNGKMSRTIH